MLQTFNTPVLDANLNFFRLPLHHNYTVPLVDQVNQWVAYASVVLPHPPRETLTTWWIGINDTGDTTTNTTVRLIGVEVINMHDCESIQITNFTAFWEEEMGSYFKAVVSIDISLTLISLYDRRNWPIPMA